MSVRTAIGKLAQRVNSWCMKTSDEFADTSLNALTPTRLSDEEFRLYENEFSFVFHNPKIRNIALMGTYGAGKSTVMETWDEKQLLAGDGHKSTFISLAHFHGSNSETSAVEGEILNQLIHKTKRSRIPKSRFRHTQDGRRFIDFLKAVFCVGYGLLTAIIIALVVRDGIVSPDSAELTHPIWVTAWLFGLVAILYFVIRRDKADRLLRRIKIFGNEIDLFELGNDQPGKESSEQHDPIFNKYMDDVLYLLNNSGSDVYVFEDIDRYKDSIELFERLRELNNLANDCRPAKLKPLRFFYLIREDLFVIPEDRVKFFDFIIPVIPFADPDGNFDELRNGLRDLGLSISDLFIYEISSFIPDSRTLKDIVNEVKHYQEHIFHGSDKPLTESEAEHLVAVIVYKVVFPADFSNFLRGKGYVAELLKRRQVLISKRRGLLEAEKEKLISAIHEIDEKNKFTLDELILTSYCDKSDFTRFGNEIYYADTTAEVIKAIRENDQASKKLDEAIEEFLKDENNLKRFGEPKEYLDKRKKGYLATIHEIDDELVVLSCSTLGKLLTESENDGVFIIKEEDLERSADFKDCEINAVQQSQHFPLLKHLLSMDLIDESSLRFVIRVRPEGLSIADQRNLAMIQGRRSIDPAYVFDKPGDVLMRIRDDYLMVPGAQNYSLLKEIFEKGETEKCSKFIAGLRHWDHPLFFFGYVTSNQFVPNVFSIMEKNFDNEAEIILTDETLSIEGRREFVHKLMCYKDDWNFDATESALVAYANNDSEILSVDDTLLAGVRRNLGEFVLSLSDIEFETADKELLNIVYEKSLYVPNAELAMKWAENRFPYHVVNRHSAISIVYSLFDERLHEFVEENMETFILSIIDSDESSLCESEDSLVWVLNALSGNQEAAESFIKRLKNCTLRDLSRIKDQALKRALLLFDIPEFSETNILDYFSAYENAIDDALAEFIQNHLNSEENRKVVIDALSDNESFVCAAVEDSNLTDENIGVILSGEGSAALTEFTMEDLRQSRVAVVLQAKRIPITGSNAQFIRANYPSCESLFAVSDIDAYLKLFNANDEAMEFDESVGLKLFESEQITPSKKVEIAKLFTSVIHLNSSYPDLLKIEIINNHFDIDDLPQLLNEFEPGGKLLQESIQNIAVTRINEITAQELPIPSGLFCAILKDPSFSANDRLEQIAFQLNLDDSIIADRECVRDCFEAAGAQDYVRLIDGKRISVPGDTTNSNVVNALMKRGMCSEKGVEPNEDGFVIVFPKGYTRQKL